jgi:hypothetical protein
VERGSVMQTVAATLAQICFDGLEHILIEG